MESFSLLIVTAHIKNRNHWLCILYTMFSLQPQIRSLSLKKSLVKLVERIFAEMKLSLSYQSYQAILLIFHSATVNTHLFLSYFKYFPRKPSVSQNLSLLSNDLKGNVAKIFPGANPRTPFLLASLVFGISTRT